MFRYVNVTLRIEFRSSREAYQKNNKTDISSSTRTRFSIEMSILPC